jgi:limonene-1,2-epoxide hydrolase
MPADHEATIRSFFDVWVERDPVRLTAFFADDGSWSEANRAGAVGHDEIRQVFEMQTGFGSQFSFEFRNLAVVGDTVFTERVDRFSLNDTPMTVPVAGVFEFAPDGRIAAWRDYYDWADLERQLLAAGVDMSGA